MEGLVSHNDTHPSIPHPFGLTDGACVQATRVPEGWTCDPDDLRRFFRPGTARWEMARYYGLTDPTLVLMETPDSGEMGYIIFSKGRYYGGDLMSDSMFEITRPKTLPGIIRAIGENDFQGLRKKELKPMELMMEEGIEGG
ncbi:hypothetical protein BDV34DRAFT_226608 [Aspergillus parasiticus]|uniref:Uncharacterized protein n=1 Tax=Aspergillus parasiticus TaxID=5067 RepID=A0A5N6DI69_ASPPA|nr:hypothetical protein BDV34DRAFT_226608 [Aspergillus parasiticus]